MGQKGSKGHHDGGKAKVAAKRPGEGRMEPNRDIDPPATFVFVDEYEAWVKAEDDVTQETQQNQLPGDGTTLESLSIATWNVWFSRDYHAMRMEAIFALLEAADPDVIALQEVTRIILADLLACPWVRAAYAVTDISAHPHGHSVSPYGNVVLSKLPIEQVRREHMMRSTQGRLALIVQLDIGGGESVTLTNVHLESRAPNTSTRVAQLTQVLDLNRAADAASEASVAARFIVGDFNFCATDKKAWTENTVQDESEFDDVWALLRPGDPGYTEDTTINVMRFRAKGHHKHVRFDRVLARPGTSKRLAPLPRTIEMIGVDPILATMSASSDDGSDDAGSDAASGSRSGGSRRGKARGASDVFPSDHFGLLCTVDLVPCATAAAAVAALASAAKGSSSVRAPPILTIDGKPLNGIASRTKSSSHGSDQSSTGSNASMDLEASGRLESTSVSDFNSSTATSALGKTNLGESWAFGDSTFGTSAMGESPRFGESPRPGGSPRLGDSVLGTSAAPSTDDGSSASSSSSS